MSHEKIQSNTETTPKIENENLNLSREQQEAYEELTIGIDEIDTAIEAEAERQIGNVLKDLNAPPSFYAKVSKILHKI